MCTKILAFAGSSKVRSLNNQVLTVACDFAKAAGADVTQLQLGDYEIPLFSEDVEAAGFPDVVVQLQNVFNDHDALLIASPEYNSSVTPLLKNTIDWVTRPGPSQSPLQSFQNKTACLISASPGALGGLRGLRHVREILSNINVLVVPGQFALSSASSAFDDNGQLNDSKQAERLKRCIHEFVSTAARVKANA